MAEYKLEIIMESRVSRVQKYIRRSFPITKGTLELSRYGYPYDRFGSIEIGELTERGNSETGLVLTFDGEDVNVCLNSFTTVRKEYQQDDPETNVPHLELLHATFYLYIE